MPDEHGYPTEQELARIQGWPLGGSSQEWMRLCCACWWAPEWGLRQEGRRLYMSTGGWSGNEEIIQAMKGAGSGLLWSKAWKVTRAGGHYQFELPSAESVLPEEGRC